MFQIIQKHIDTLTSAVGNLQQVHKLIDSEIDIAGSQGQTALRESRNLREEWLEKITLHFDMIDIKINAFLDDRLESLHRLKHRIEVR